MKKITIIVALIMLTNAAANCQLLSGGFTISAGAQQQVDDITKDTSFKAASMCQFRVEISDLESPSGFFKRTYASIGFGAGGNKVMGRLYFHASAGVHFFNGNLAVGPTIQYHYKSPAYDTPIDKAYLGVEIQARYGILRLYGHAQKDFFSVGIGVATKFFD